jgi:hypothetical protein
MVISYFFMFLHTHPITITITTTTTGYVVAERFTARV